MSQSVETIPIQAFSYCTSLKEFTVPEKVKVIGSYAFGKCSALESIDLPGGITEIGSSAFRECSSLKSFTYPSTIEIFDLDQKVSSATANILYACDSLTTLEIDGGENEDFKSDGNCIIRKSDNALIIGCAGSVIPNYVTKIGRYAFSSCGGLSEINIPSGVQTVEMCAFEKCKGLRRVTMADGVKTIYPLAFSGCIELESVYIPSTLQTWACKENHLFESLEKYRNVFPKCPNLKTIEVAENNPVYKSDGNCIIEKQTNVLVEGCIGSIIPDYVSKIGDYAFCECDELKELTLANGIEEIGSYAYADCINLKTAYMPVSLTKIGDNAFRGCCFISITLKSGNKGKLPNSTYVGGSLCEIKLDGDYPYVYSKRGFDHSLGSGKSYGLIAPSRKGYKFLGWTTQEGSMLSEVAAQNLELLHKWESIDHSIVKHKENILVSLRPKNYDLSNSVVYYAIWIKE